MEFKVIRSNRKTIAAEIRQNKLIIRAPLSATNEDINRFMLANKKWIDDHLAKAQAREKAMEGIHRLTQEEIQAIANRALEVIPERVAHYAPLVGVTYGRITIRNQRSKWGSCSSKGNLNFNCLLMLTPPEVIDSVVVHELCHRKEMNHSERFYAEVLRVFPDYWAQDKWLKDNGDILMMMLTKLEKGRCEIMGAKRSTDPGLQYLLDIGFHRIKGKYGLADRFNKVFGKTKAKEIWDTWQRLPIGTKEFYDFKNSDPEISRAFSEAFDGDIIRKACNYVFSHKDYFGSTILEVGCDCGMISCFLAKTFPDARIVSIDRCAAAIEIAKNFARKQGLANVTFQCCDLTDVEGAFDTVFSMRTLHENNEAEEDIVNDLGEQASVFKGALIAYAASLSKLLADQGRLISIERIGRNALLLGWMEAMDAVELAFDLSCYEELICEEAGDESVFQAFVCFKGIESEIAAKDMFDFACSKYLDYTQAEYEGWDAKIVFENRRGKLIEGYAWEWSDSHAKGRMSLWTHATDETCLIAYQNNNGNVFTTFHDISQKDELLEGMHKAIEESRAHSNCTVTELAQ